MIMKQAAGAPAQTCWAALSNPLSLPKNFISAALCARSPSGSYGGCWAWHGSLSVMKYGTLAVAHKRYR